VNTNQHYLLIYLLTPWSTVLLEKLTGSHLANKFPAFYGTRKFITVFTSASHLSLSFQVRGFPCEWKETGYVFTVMSCSTSPKPHDGGPLLVGCLRLLIQYICSYPPYWTQFLHPQPEDAPCRSGGTHWSHSWVIKVNKSANSAEHFLQFEVDKTWANQEITSFCRRKKFIADYIELSPHTFYWYI
jgi:hypothetical protein